MTRVLAASVAGLLLVACFSGESNLTESGKGKPEVTLDFPSSVEPRSTESLVVDVTNPGPEAMTSLLVTFSLVGGGASGVPSPLIGVGSDAVNPSIVDVDPNPERVSEDGVVFHFPGLAEGESTTIEFEVFIPPHEGPASNSVIVQDGQELDRARGVLLRTTVEE